VKRSPDNFRSGLELTPQVSDDLLTIPPGQLVEFLGRQFAGIDRRFGEIDRQGRRFETGTLAPGAASGVTRAEVPNTSL
jgi:hypothetical protein